MREKEVAEIWAWRKDYKDLQERYDKLRTQFKASDNECRILCQKINELVERNNALAMQLKEAYAQIKNGCKYLDEFWKDQKENGHYIKGGQGSHWESCSKTHWDCRIVHLEKQLKEIDNRLHQAIHNEVGLEAQLKEANEFLEGRESYISLLELQKRVVEDKLKEANEENERLSNAWFIDETIAPDQTLRPTLSALIKRVEQAEKDRDAWKEDAERLSCHFVHLMEYLGTDEDKKCVCGESNIIKQHQERIVKPAHNDKCS